VLKVSRPGSDFLTESDQRTLKVGIHSFPCMYGPLGSRMDDPLGS